MDDTRYFATLPQEEVGAAIAERIDRYYLHLQDIGRLQLWRNGHQAYYRGVYEGGRIHKDGEQGELMRIYINQYRNILQHMVNMVTQNKPAFEPRAANTDFDSQAQCIVANAILEQDMREKRLSRLLKRAVEAATNYDSAFVYENWNATAGQDYGVGPDGKLMREGDLEYRVVLPIDCVRDHTRRSSDGHQWFCIKSYRSRWDLMAKFPDLADKIRGLPSASEEDNQRRIDSRYKEDESDLVVYWEFLHEKTDVVPDGRIVEFASDECVFIDSPLPTKKIALYRIAGTDQDESIHGYTVMYDLLPLQTATDAVVSSIISNAAAFGVQNIWVKKGSDITRKDLGGGLNVIESLEMPQPLSLLATPKELYQLVEMLNQMIETISGINSVTRGNPEASLKSGASLALVASQAIQFSSGLQESYINLVEDVGTGAIQIYEQNVTNTRKVAIAGKANRQYLRAFTGKDLSGIERVTVDMGSAVSRTLAGKMEIAQQLLQAGMIDNPQQYIQVMNTGRIEPMIQGKTAELMLISSENERLAMGVQVTAIRSDKHDIHLEEHRTVIASPEARETPEVVQAVLDHMAEHEQFMAPPMPMMGPGEAPGPGLPAANEVMDPNAGAPGVPGMPSMPTNPLTGEKAPEPANAPMAAPNGAVA